MTDITLKTINSGYNLNKINDNFVTLEDNINNTSIQSTGGNNVMSQDFDMNSKRMINLPAPVSGSEPIRLSDAEALASQTTGGSTISETPPTINTPGDRWTRCSDMKAFLWYVDVDGGQWIEDRPSYGIDTIQNLTLPYEFTTVAAYKAFTVSFPVGKIINLLDRGASFTIGSDTGNARNIIASDEVAQSATLIQPNYNPIAWGAIDDGASNGTENLIILQAIVDTNNFFVLGGRNEDYAISGGYLSLGFFQGYQGNGGIITQLDSDTPIIKHSSSRFFCKNLRIKYATQQTLAHTKSYGILFDAAFEGAYSNVVVEKAYRGFGVNDETLFDGSSFAYMLNIGSCRSLDAADWGFYFANNGSIGMTTNTFIGCYALQSANNNANTSSKGFAIGAHTGGATLIDCAADKLQSSAILIATSTNVSVRGFDIESCNVTDEQIIDINSSTNTDINGVMIDVNTFNGSTCSLVRVSGTSRNVKVSGRERGSIDNATNTYGVQTISSSEDCQVNAYNFISDSGFDRSDGLTPNSHRQIHSYNFNIYAEKIGVTAYREYRTSVPTTGTWGNGDRIKNTSPTNVNPIDEWACIIGGTPGSWRVTSSITVKGTTGSRPSGLTASEFGVQYLDTTLSANGKLITWNGSLWVDSTGASV